VEEAQIVISVIVGVALAIYAVWERYRARPGQ